MKKIISILIIILSIGSMANAWTWNDFIDFCYQYSINGTGNQKTVASNIYNQRTKLYNMLINKGYDPADYDNFLVYNRQGVSNPQFEIYMWNYNSNGTFNISSTGFNMSNITGVYCYIYQGSQNYNGNGSKTSISSSGNQITYYIGLQTLLKSNYYNQVFENQYTYVIMNENTPIHIGSFPYFIASYSAQSTDTIGIYDTNNNIISTTYRSVDKDVNYGSMKQYNLWIDEKGNLQEETPYTINISRDNVFIAKSTIFEIDLDLPPTYIPGGTITNPSGEVTGNVDLTNIENSLNNIDQGIQELPNKIYNESGEQGIVQKIYDDLFTISDNYIEDKLENLRQNNGISGDTTYEKAFLEIINNNNGDFKIAWASYSPHFSIKGQQINTSGDMIPSGEVNFSKMERENPSLQESMKWVRVILGFAMRKSITS